MAESSEMLRLRALLGFYNDDNVTVTGLSRSLGEEKYTISRLLSSLEEEGLVDRSNNRHPKLTEQGLEVAERYAERVDTMENYLLYKGVSGENALPDALSMSLHLSDQSVGVFREEEAMEAVKYEFRERRKFSGSEFFSKLARCGNEIYLKKLGIDAETGEIFRTYDSDGIFFALTECREYENGKALANLRMFA